VKGTLDFKGAVKPCAQVEDACTVCGNALALPIVAAGVSPLDTATLLACGAAQSTAILAAGVPARTLAAIANCPPPVVEKTCTVKVTASDFNGTVAECSNPATACSASCVYAVRKPFIDKGVSASDQVGLSSCIATYADIILAAGVPKQTVADWGKCHLDPSLGTPRAGKTQQSSCVTNCVSVGTYCDNAKDSNCIGSAAG
jgi:hypothetical protein